MFNSPKTNEITSQIKDNTEHLVESAKEAASDIAAETKDAAQTLGKKIQATTVDTKSDAEALIASLRELLAEKPLQTKAEEIKTQLAGQYNEWKDTVQHEVELALKESQARSRKVLNDQPLLTLAVAVGAGAFIGYLIGSHQSSEQKS
ncbi:MAG: hypothetical protein ACXW1P_02170 [Methylophilaceae bacterium]